MNATIKPSLETVAFAPPDLLCRTVQTSFTILLTPIYSKAVSKLYFSPEHIVANFILDAFVNGAIQILFIIIMIIILPFSLSGKKW